MCSKIRLGLCCINTYLRTEGIFTSRSCTLATVSKYGREEIYRRAYQNLADLSSLMKWNYNNGIFVLRMSSGLIPHASNSKRLRELGIEPVNLDDFDEYFEKIGELSKIYKQRLTFHPGQYNVLGTPNIEALQSTYEDLSYHAKVLDKMNLPPESVMVIHGGGTYNDKEKTIERWIERYKNLDTYIKKRLVLENCERQYNIKDCLYISRQCGIPIVLDIHHDAIYRMVNPDCNLKPIKEYLPEIFNTWGCVRPKIHISEHGEGRLGNHSDYIEEIPEYLIYSGYEFDIMIEAKMKEKAIIRLYEKYHKLFC